MPYNRCCNRSHSRDAVLQSVRARLLFPPHDGRRENERERERKTSPPAPSNQPRLLLSAPFKARRNKAGPILCAYLQLGYEALGRSWGRRRRRRWLFSTWRLAAFLQLAAGEGERAGRWLSGSVRFCFPSARSPSWLMSTLENPTAHVRQR